MLLKFVPGCGWAVMCGKALVPVDGVEYFDSFGKAREALAPDLVLLESHAVVERCATIGHAGRPSTGTIVYREPDAERATYERVCTSCGVSYPSASWLELGPVTWISDLFRGEVKQGERND